MNIRRLMCTLLDSFTVLGCTISSAGAAEVPDETIVWLEDMEWVDLPIVEYWDINPMPLTTDSIDKSISKYSIGYVTHSIDLNANDMVTFNCSYSPLSASIDFGVIASNGRFYYINVKEGSINQTIRISQSGSYTVAIRNNSSQTVRVVGFVNY